MTTRFNQRRRGNGLFIAIVLLVLVLVAAVALYLLIGQPSRGLSPSIAGGSPATTQAAPRPTSRPAPQFATIIIPALKHPLQTVNKSNDDRVNSLLAVINNRLQGVNQVEMKGACAWFHSVNPHAMTISYNLKTQTGEVFCNELHGTITDGSVTMQKGQPMQVDSLYLLMLRSYDPAQFTSSIEEALSIGDQVIDCIRLDGTDETLWVAEQGGNPVRLKTSVKDGPVTVDFEPGNWPSPVVPAKLKVTVPRKWFGFPLDAKDDPVVEFTVDPKSIKVQ